MDQFMKAAVLHQHSAKCTNLRSIVFSHTQYAVRWTIHSQSNTKKAFIINKYPSATLIGLRNTGLFCSSYFCNTIAPSLPPRNCCDLFWTTLFLPEIPHILVRSINPHQTTGSGHKRVVTRLPFANDRSLLPNCSTKQVWKHKRGRWMVCEENESNEAW